MDLYIGLMSGTSTDAVDAALVDFSDDQIKLIAAHDLSLDASLRDLLLQLSLPCKDDLNLAGQASIQAGEAFAQATNELLKKTKLTSADIKAIGSHGQTIRHYPNESSPFTIQIGDPNIIAARTNITTVADFRRKDMANGGQGAPLTPVFHKALLQTQQPHEDAVFLNIGGIANITVIKANTLLGFDTGPGNTLLDAWTRKHHKAELDNQGRWAASGAIDQALLRSILLEPYFKMSLPKSTGKELFNLDWLDKHLEAINKDILLENIQATLVELTATTIADNIKTHMQKPCDIFVCGGGIHNNFLIQQLKSKLNDYQISSTKVLGADPDWIEAMAFAWFAKQTMEKQPVDLCSITGAKKPAILGGIYCN